MDEEFLERLRQRPGMYLGNVRDAQGVLRTIEVFVELALDAHAARHTLERVDVTVLSPRRVRIELRGVALAPVCCSAEDCARGGRASCSLGDCAMWPHRNRPGAGVGVVALAAVLSHLQIESVDAGRLWRQRFSRGRPLAAREWVGTSHDAGLVVEYELDDAIFDVSTVGLEASRIAVRFEELASLTPGVLFTVSEASSERSWAFLTQRGVVEWLERRLPARTVIFDIGADGLVVDESGACLSVALAPHDARLVASFVNGAATRNEGAHVIGVAFALAGALIRIAPRALPGRSVHWLVRHVLEAFAVIVSLDADDVLFGDSTGGRLISPDYSDSIAHHLEPQLGEWLDAHPDIVRLTSERLAQIRESS